MKTQNAEASPAEGALGPNAYDTDVILWAEEQARLLRAGRFAELDIEHLADEIEDVGRSEKHELASRMAVLLAHLLKWRLQPEKRTRNFREIISNQRRRVEIIIKETPSLKAALCDPHWQLGAWLDAKIHTYRETNLDSLPDARPWSMDEARDPDFWPE